MTGKLPRFLVALTQSVLLSLLAYGAVWLLKGRPSMPALHFVAILAPFFLASFGLQRLADRVNRRRRIP